VKFRVYIAVSGDGYVANADGNAGWLDSFQAEHYGCDASRKRLTPLSLGVRHLIRHLGCGDESYHGKTTFVLTSRLIGTPHPQTIPWHERAAKLVDHLLGPVPDRDVWLLGGPESIPAFRELGL